jgi:hypothetical protein
MAVQEVQKLQLEISEDPYCCARYLLISRAYREAGYPDLATGAAYKALLLVDEILDDSSEYHEQATLAANEYVIHGIDSTTKPVSDLNIGSGSPETDDNEMSSKVTTIAAGLWRANA